MQYFLGVIVDKEDSDIEELMEPYSNNLEVPEYEVNCDCVGEVARCHASIVSKKYTKYVEVWRSEYNIHWLKDEPEKDCGCCEGSGKTMSTDNPNGKWRWFEAGGRWDGFVKDNIVSVKKYINIIDQTRYKSRVLTGKFDNILLPNNWVGVRRFSRRKLIELLSPYEDKWIIGLDCEG